MQRQTKKKFGAVTLFINPRGLGWISTKRFTNQAQTFATMSKKELRDTKICTDLKVIMKTELPQEGKTYKGKLTYHDADSSTFEEDAPRKQRAAIPERKQTVLARTVHGKMSADKYGVHVGFYFRNDEIGNNAWLGDRLEGESEQMSDLLENMEELVCGK